MVKETRDSFDFAAGQTAEFAKQIQQMMAIYFSWFQNTTSVWKSMNPDSRLFTHANKRVGAASIYLSKLSRATDLQEIAKIQMEYMQMRMLMFNDLTKEAGDAVSVASNLLGGFISLLNWQKILEDLARNSPTYRQTGGSERVRTWSAVSTQEGQSAEDDGRKTTRRPKQ
jgi:hypothetical protein